MANRYAAHLSPSRTPQSEPAPGKPMAANAAGGYAFTVDDWARLDRFLIMGNPGGTYYASERQLTLENAECVLRCAALDPTRTVARIAEVSDRGLAPKNDPAVFALALCAAQKADLSRLALAALPKVCRIPTHLFQFVSALKSLGKGWSRSLRRAVGEWYTCHETE